MAGATACVTSTVSLVNRQTVALHPQPKEDQLPNRNEPQCGNLDVLAQVVRRHGRKSHVLEFEKLVRERVPLAPAQVPNERWAMDFVRETLPTGPVFRTLTGRRYVHAQEALAIAVHVSLPGDLVVDTLEAIARDRGESRAIMVDIGAAVPESRGECVGESAQARVHFIRRRGKPSTTRSSRVFVARPVQNGTRASR